MASHDDLPLAPDPGDDAAARDGPPAPLADEPPRSPQWGEAYLLFDGQYRSLDDLLAATDD